MAQVCGPLLTEERKGNGTHGRWRRRANRAARTLMRVCVVFTAIGGFVQTVELLENWLGRLHL